MVDVFYTPIFNTIKSKKIQTNVIFNRKHSLQNGFNPSELAKSIEIIRDRYKSIKNQENLICESKFFKKIIDKSEKSQNSTANSQTTFEKRENTPNSIRKSSLANIIHKISAKNKKNNFESNLVIDKNNDLQKIMEKIGKILLKYRLNQAKLIKEKYIMRKEIEYLKYRLAKYEEV